MVGMLGCGCCGCNCSPQYKGEFNYSFDTLPPELVNVPYPNSGNLNGLVANGKLRSTLSAPLLVPGGASQTRREVGVRSSFQNKTNPTPVVGCYKEYSIEAYAELTSPSPNSFYNLQQNHGVGIGFYDESGFRYFLGFSVYRAFGGGYVVWFYYRTRLYVNTYSWARMNDPLPLANHLKLRLVYFGENNWQIAAYVNGVKPPSIREFSPAFTPVQCDFWPYLFHVNDIYYRNDPGFEIPGQTSVACFDDFKQTFVPA